MLLLLLLLTKQRYLYHACECVLEHMCILHLLFYNLLYYWKIVCSPPKSQLLIWSLIIMFQQER